MVHLHLGRTPCPVTPRCRRRPDAMNQSFMKSQRTTHSEITRPHMIAIRLPARIKKTSTPDAVLRYECTEHTIDWKGQADLCAGSAAVQIGE